jgi:hypothetical protein
MQRLVFRLSAGHAICAELVVYYYKINRKTGQFARYPISVNGTAGVGMQFVLQDLDGDGDIDLATAGKTGVHFFTLLVLAQCAHSVANWHPSLKRHIATYADVKHIL